MQKNYQWAAADLPSRIILVLFKPAIWQHNATYFSKNARVVTKHLVQTKGKYDGFHC
jgi:hypothetical protein